MSRDGESLTAEKSGFLGLRGRRDLSSKEGRDLKKTSLTKVWNGGKGVGLGKDVKSVTRKDKEERRRRLQRGRL